MPTLKNVDAKDFGGPKKARSAYFVYLDKTREGVTAEIKKTLKEGEKFNIAMTARRCAEQWKSVSEEERKTCQETADSEKNEYKKLDTEWRNSPKYQEYQKAMAEYNKKKKDKAATKEIKEKGMPKKPATSWMLFMSESMAKVIEQLKAAGTELSMANRSQECKKLWEALPAEEKQVYEQRAKEQKDKYEEDMGKFKETEDYKEWASKMETNRSAKRKAEMKIKEAVREAKRQKILTADEIEEERKVGMSEIEEKVAALPEEQRAGEKEKLVTKLEKRLKQEATKEERLSKKAAKEASQKAAKEKLAAEKKAEREAKKKAEAAALNNLSPEKTVETESPEKSQIAEAKPEAKPEKEEKEETAEVPAV